MLKLRNNKIYFQLEWLFGALLIVVANAFLMYHLSSRNYSIPSMTIIISLNMVASFIELYYIRKEQRDTGEKKIKKIYSYVAISIASIYLQSGQAYIPFGLLLPIYIYHNYGKDISFFLLCHQLSILYLLNYLDSEKILVYLLVTPISFFLIRPKQGSPWYKYYFIILFFNHGSIYLLYNGLSYPGILTHLIVTAVVYGLFLVLLYLGMSENKDFLEADSILITQVKTESINHNERDGKFEKDIQGQGDIIKESKDKPAPSSDKGDRNGQIELLVRLRNHSQEEYYLAKVVSTISYEAAAFIACDKKLAGLGGLYHRIGCILPGNYIKNGVSILQEYNVEEDIITIILGHNLNYGIPINKESFVVMLTTSIIHTLNRLNIIDKTNKYQLDTKYREQNQEGYIEHIIGQVLDLRFRKVSMYSFQLSKREIEELEYFYKKNMILILRR